MNLSIKRIKISFIKDNLSLILLFPTLLGGIWQLIELGLIGVPYIRFFSPSQIIADGLLIVFIFVCAIILVQGWASPEENSKNESQEETSSPQETTNTRNLPKKWYWYIIAAIAGCLILFFYVLIPTLSLILKEKKTTGLIFICAIASAVMILIFLAAAFDVLMKIRGFRLAIKAGWMMTAAHFLLSLLISSVAIFGLVVLAYTMRIFHNSFMLPDNLLNYKYVRCKIKKMNPSLKTFEMVYYNDKYIFLKITDSSNETKMEVLNFDAFMDNSTCDTK